MAKENSTILLDIDTDKTGGTSVCGTGTHRLAGDGVLEKKFVGDAMARSCKGKDPEMLRQYGRRADQDRFASRK